MNNKIRIVLYVNLFFLFVIMLSNLSSAQIEQNNKTSVIYFTSLNCPNCAFTDSIVLEEWPKKYSNLVIIEYVFEKWTDENAMLLGEYSEKYNFLSAVPNLILNENKNYLGRINILEANKEFEKSNSVLLLENSVFFEELNLNELPNNPKIWTNERVLIKIGNKEISNSFLKNLLFAENLDKLIENSEYLISEINPEPLSISDGEILFENAINIEDSWILEFNNGIHFNLPDKNRDSLNIPLIGKIEASSLSLPLITLLIGLVDGFNPCAFFILTLLLAAMLYTTASVKEKNKRRKRLAIVGGIFLFFSGFVYFMFMSLWLNVFLYAKQIVLLTFVAGLIAIFAGIINIKDYFYFQKGISLTLPKKQKNRFKKRVEELTKVKSLGALLLGTIIIAVTVNLYELLCTVGFPMVYLGALTARELSSFSYYFYLLLYNLFYLIPLAVIVIIFIVTLGAKEFSRKNVQRLKLISGFMVLSLGLILIFKPEILENLITPFLTIFISIFLSIVIIYSREFRNSSRNF